MDVNDKNETAAETEPKGADCSTSAAVAAALMEAVMLPCGCGV